MFTRYWRSYPRFLQMVLLMLMIFTFASLSWYIILALIPKMPGVTRADLNLNQPGTPTLAVGNAVLLMQAINTLFAFAVPSLLFAYFTHPRSAEYLGFRLPGRSIQWVWVTGMMLGLLPFLVAGETYSETHLHFGKWADDMQRENDNGFSKLLSLRGNGALLKLLIVTAVITPFSEELFFRSILMRLASGRSRAAMTLFTIGDQPVQIPARRMSIVFPIVVSSVFFALMHGSPYGFIFILIAGVVLAVIYWLTSSLWCSMWAHLLCNGVQVIAVYEASQSTKLTQVMNGQIPVSIVLGGLLLFGASLYGLVKTKTPLAPGWSDDYAPGEVQS